MIVSQDSEKHLGLGFGLKHRKQSRSNRQQSFKDRVRFFLGDCRQIQLPVFLHDAACDFSKFLLVFRVTVSAGNLLLLNRSPQQSPKSLRLCHPRRFHISIHQICDFRIIDMERRVQHCTFLYKPSGEQKKAAHPNGLRETVRACRPNDKLKIKLAGQCQRPHVDVRDYE